MAPPHLLDTRLQTSSTKASTASIHCIPEPEAQYRLLCMLGAMAVATQHLTSIYLGQEFRLTPVTIEGDTYSYSLFLSVVKV